MAAFGLGPIDSNQDLIIGDLSDSQDTYYISGNLNAHHHRITIVAKNIIVQPGVTISGTRLKIRCNQGVFITLGTIDTPRLRIRASEMYFGGQKSARTNNVIIDETAQQNVHYGDEAALGAIGRIAQQFAIHRFQLPNP
ncbi:MAG: hypothetical protein JSS10_05375 [Verrucomicrobia bacterium]|nr:hypothetical protein [Verrucomicrobiota bacterium]